ncbi:MAG: TetR/AcrR family transcriptional regulator [Nitriliruptorales bacterium]|nr:TetR/AcrR family transcriptional regulator [Nitriliruptorales bacterium]
MTNDPTSTVRRNSREPGPRGQQTRQRLLEAGHATISERGYHDTRVDDIVRRAGTSHGTFYLYFESKDDLLDALRQQTDEALDELADALPELIEGEDGQLAFREWIEKFDEFYSLHGPVIGAHVNRGRSPDAEVDSFEVFAALQERLATAIDDAGCEVAAQVAALAIVAMLERFAFFSPEVIGEPNGHRDEALDTLARLSHSGLFA